MASTTTAEMRRRLERIAAKIDTVPTAHRPHLAALIDSLGRLLDQMTGHAD